LQDAHYGLGEGQRVTKQSAGVFGRSAAALQVVLWRWPPAHTQVVCWGAFVIGTLIVALVLAAAAKQLWQVREHESPAPAPTLQAPLTARAKPTADKDVLARPPSGAAKAVALQTLDLALGTAPGVQLVATEFSSQLGSAERLDRTDVAFRVRGPYADIKRVLSIWSTRFQAGSVLALRVQQQPSAPGMAEASVNSAIWSRPGVTPQSTPTSESPR
jgi:hypothetical protein